MAIKLFYYIKRFSYNKRPTSFFKKRYDQLLEFEKTCNKALLEFRLDYYMKHNTNFKVPAEAIAVKDFKKTRGTEYFLDLKEFLHYFSPETKFAYHFGDETHINSFPTLFKARPIAGKNENSVLFKLNKSRHFKWVDDPLQFSEKKSEMVWRGGAYKELRRNFVEKLWGSPLCDVGQTNKPKENVPWQKPKLSIAEQLKYKFIFCPEGNDVATNLKWAMSSNSLCIMPKPRYETWFMEGMLIPGVHYVEVTDDIIDLTAKLAFYSSHPKEAEKIIKNAHQHVAQFKNKDLEDLLCLKVLEKYSDLSQQENAKKFAKD